jgi:hypothetical protein
MANTYTWAINSLKCYPTYDSQTDVVFSATWTCTGVSSDATPVTSSISNSQSLIYVAGTPFVPYNQLTQDQILGWIWASGVDKTATENDVGRQIQQLITPSVVTQPLPWSA